MAVGMIMTRPKRRYCRLGQVSFLYYYPRVTQLYKFATVTLVGTAEASNVGYVQDEAENVVVESKR